MGTHPTFRLPVISGRTFTNETVVVDGKRFENCKFIGCHIVYSGAPAEASSCQFSPNTTWEFQAAAAMTVQTLQRFGWRFEYGAEGPLAPAIEIPMPKP
jgi:hypothetical protein